MTGAELAHNMTSAAPSLNMTGAVPSLNVTSAAPSLNMTGAVPSLNVTGAVPSLNMTGAAPSLNMTTAGSNMTGIAPTLNMTGAVNSQTNHSETPPSLDLSGAPADLAEITSNLSLDDSIDPFHPDTHAALLASLAVPVSAMHGYRQFDGKMPQVRLKSLLSLNEDVFYISECKGEGGF